MWFHLQVLRSQYLKCTEPTCCDMCHQIYIKDSSEIHHQSQDSHLRDICGFHFIIFCPKKMPPTQLGRPTFLITRLCGQLPDPKRIRATMPSSRHVFTNLLPFFSAEKLYPFGAVLLGFLQKWHKNFRTPSTHWSGIFCHGSWLRSVFGTDDFHRLFQRWYLLWRMRKVQATSLGFQIPPWHSNSLVISSFERSHEPSSAKLYQWLQLAVCCRKPERKGISNWNLPRINHQLYPPLAFGSTFAGWLARWTNMFGLSIKKKNVNHIWISSHFASQQCHISYINQGTDSRET